MLSREQIINEIRRTALENGGAALGMGNFEKATGIKKNDWFGKYWAKWGDALTEAGFSPNQFGSPAYDEERLLQKLVDIVRELGHFPTKGELKLRHFNDPEFPSLTTLNKRLGYQKGMIQKVSDYCQRHYRYQDVLKICSSLLPAYNNESVSPIDDDDISYGFVYLIKSGKHYKIGRSNDTGRRSYELNIQLPERPDLIHEIRTDDPAGIEAYWHKRFAKKRRGGEWFELDQKDIRAFKRRKFM